LAEAVAELQKKTSRKHETQVTGTDVLHCVEYLAILQPHPECERISGAWRGRSRNHPNAVWQHRRQEQA
jgi:hypothetical protein